MEDNRQRGEERFTSVVRLRKLHAAFVMENRQTRIALKVSSLHYGLKEHKKILRLVPTRLSWAGGRQKRERGVGGREGERERTNANSSRLADIKFAFILCSVIYDTDLSHAVNVRTLVIVFPRVCTRALRCWSN